MELRNLEQQLAQFRSRVWVAGLFATFCFGLVLARMFFLQVIRHEDLLEQAESNRIAVLPVVPHRGLITDRNGVVLANNYSAYTLEITPSKAGKLDEVIEGLKELIEITPRDLRRFKRLSEESRRFDSIPIRTRLSDEEIARFAAQRYRFPGVEIQARLFRHYPLGETASHVIGYIGRIKGGRFDGAMFAPKYVENKLKFFSFVKEAVAYGDQRDRVCVMINIDFDAVGNWAERQNLPYAGYTDLSQKAAVYDMIKECVEKVNADLSRDEMLAGSQISRFVILHKELDPDDGVAVSQHLPRLIGQCDDALRCDV